MTTQTFLALPARERDALVAVHIMGNEVTRMQGGPDSGEHLEIFKEAKDTHVYALSPYTTDISAAWAVVEHIHGVWDIGTVPDGWYVQLAVRTDGGHSDRFVRSSHVKAPTAICIAALKAVGFITA